MESTETQSTGLETTTLEQIEGHIAVLTARANELRGKERAAAIEAIKRQMTVFLISVADLGIGAAPKAGKQHSIRPAAGKPMYRDPVTGKTWTGKGRRPTWCPAEREAQLLIEQSAVALAA